MYDDDWGPTAVELAHTLVQLGQLEYKLNALLPDERQTNTRLYSEFIDKLEHAQTLTRFDPWWVPRGLRAYIERLVDITEQHSQGGQFWELIGLWSQWQRWAMAVEVAARLAGVLIERPNRVTEQLLARVEQDEQHAASTTGGRSVRSKLLLLRLVLQRRSEAIRSVNQRYAERRSRPTMPPLPVSKVDRVTLSHFGELTRIAMKLASASLAEIRDDRDSSRLLGDSGIATLEELQASLIESHRIVPVAAHVDNLADGRLARTLPDLDWMIDAIQPGEQLSRRDAAPSVEWRRASWFVEATHEGLYADLLKAAVRDERVRAKKHTDRARGHWLYDVQSVADEWPQYRHALAAKLKSEGIGNGT